MQVRGLVGGFSKCIVSGDIAVAARCRRPTTPAPGSAFIDAEGALQKAEFDRLAVARASTNQSRAIQRATGSAVGGRIDGVLAVEERPRPRGRARGCRRRAGEHGPRRLRAAPWLALLGRSRHRGRVAERGRALMASVFTVTATCAVPAEPAPLREADARLRHHPGARERTGGMTAPARHDLPAP